MTDAEIHLTFMRHGRSRADDEEVHEGRYDSPLTEVGRAQVQARANLWKEQGVAYDLIIASPLCRARESAEIIVETLGSPLEVNPDWMEFDNGHLAGMPEAEAAIRFPKPDFHNPYLHYHGSRESEWDFYSRAARAVQNVIMNGPGSYLVVAHGGILNSALRTIMQSPVPTNESGVWFRFGDAGYARLLYLPDKHVWVLLELCR
jgi:2,3-bisphosphoglycerate-dependent phosphoglycerate mutase